MGGSKASSAQTTTTATDDARLVAGSGLLAADEGRIISFFGGGRGKPGGGGTGGQAVTDQGIGVQAGGDIVAGTRYGDIANRIEGEGNTITVNAGAAEVRELAETAIAAIEAAAQSAAQSNLAAIGEVLDKASEVTATEDEQKQKQLYYAALGAIALGGIYLATRGR